MAITSHKIPAAATTKYCLCPECQPCASMAWAWSPTHHTSPCEHTTPLHRQSLLVSCIHTSFSPRCLRTCCPDRDTVKELMSLAVDSEVRHPILTNICSLK